MISFINTWVEGLFGMFQGSEVFLEWLVGGLGPGGLGFESGYIPLADICWIYSPTQDAQSQMKVINGY